MHFTCQKFRRPEHSRNAVRKFPFLLCLWFRNRRPFILSGFRQATGWASFAEYVGIKATSCSAQQQRRFQNQHAAWPMCDVAVDDLLDGFGQRHLLAADLLGSFRCVVAESQLAGQVKAGR